MSSLGGWHERFAAWAKPPSETEQEKAERAARMVRDALRGHSRLKDRNFEVVAIGSYRNNTNIRANSDIDLAAVLRETSAYDLPSNGSVTREMVGLRDATYKMGDFRADLTAALNDGFGAQEVAPGKIALTIEESGARLPADVTPFLNYRRYTGTKLHDGTFEFQGGIETRPLGSPGTRLIQWPDQHYGASVAKNSRTNHRFKRVVRILKRLRDELVPRFPELKAVRSCFLEHAIFNAPDDLFNRDPRTYYDDVRRVVAYLWAESRRASVTRFTQVGGMDLLFLPHETWSTMQLERTMNTFWRIVGFTAVA